MKMTLRYRCILCGKEIKNQIDADPAQMKLPTAPDEAVLGSGIWQQSWGLHRCDPTTIGCVLFIGITMENG